MPILKENIHRYPTNWKNISWFIRTIRAESRCEFCGARHGKPHPVTGSIVVLTCAHLDHTPESNFIDLGLFVSPVALCQRCHNRYDSNHRKRNFGKKKNTRRKHSK